MLSLLAQARVCWTGADVFYISVALEPGVLPNGIAHVFPAHFHFAGGDTRRRTLRAPISWPRSRVWAFAPGLRASLDPAPGLSLPALSLAPGFGASAPGFGLPLPASWGSLPALGYRSRLFGFRSRLLGPAPGFARSLPALWARSRLFGIRSRLLGLAPGFGLSLPAFWARSRLCGARSWFLGFELVLTMGFLTGTPCCPTVGKKASVS